MFWNMSASCWIIQLLVCIFINTLAYNSIQRSAGGQLNCYVHRVRKTSTEARKNCVDAREQSFEKRIFLIAKLHWKHAEHNSDCNSSIVTRRTGTSIIRVGWEKRETGWGWGWERVFRVNTQGHFKSTGHCWRLFQAAPSVLALICWSSPKTRVPKRYNEELTTTNIMSSARVIATYNFEQPPFA